MTADPIIDPAGFLAEHLERAEPDLLWAMLRTFVDALMGAEADAICGAPYGARSSERTNSRNGYRTRDWDTRAGSMEVAIPKLRSGSYFPDWLLERRKRVLLRTFWRSDRWALVWWLLGGTAVYYSRASRPRGNTCPRPRSSRRPPTWSAMRASLPCSVPPGHWTRSAGRWPGRA